MKYPDDYNLELLKQRADALRTLKQLSYLEKSEYSSGYPSIWEIETTSRCPMTCISCPRSYGMTRKHGDMDIDLFKSIIDQLLPEAQLGPVDYPRVQLMHYGEPAFYKYFAESIEYTANKGFYVLTSCNASCLSPQRARECVDSGLHELWMITDGLDDKTSQAIRGKAASASQAEINLQYLFDYKQKKNSKYPIVQVCMIRQPANKHQWEAFKEKWKDNENIENSYLSYYSTVQGNIPEMVKNADELAMNDAEQQEWHKYIAERNRYMCYYPWHSMSILWDGRVVPCCRDYDGVYILGDLNKQFLSEIWNDEPIRKLRRQMIAGSRDNILCSKCREGSLEIGVPFADKISILSHCQQVAAITNKESFYEKEQTWKLSADEAKVLEKRYMTIGINEASRNFIDHGILSSYKLTVAPADTNSNINAYLSMELNPMLNRLCVPIEFPQDVNLRLPLAESVVRVYFQEFWQRLASEKRQVILRYAGRFARYFLRVVSETAGPDVVAVWDDNPAIAGKTLFGCKIVNHIDDLEYDTIVLLSDNKQLIDTAQKQADKNLLCPMDKVEQWPLEKNWFFQVISQ